MKFLTCSLLALAFTSCLSSPPPVPDGIEVRINPDHQHSRYCGHYAFGESWYYVRQHKHATNCGHVFDAKRRAWVIKD